MAATLVTSEVCLLHIIVTAEASCQSHLAMATHVLTFWQHLHHLMVGAQTSILRLDNADVLLEQRDTVLQLFDADPRLIVGFA